MLWCGYLLFVYITFVLLPLLLKHIYSLPLDKKVTIVAIFPLLTFTLSILFCLLFPARFVFLFGILLGVIVLRGDGDANAIQKRDL